MHDGEFDPTNLRYQFPGFGIVIFRIVKITTDAILLIFGFANVDKCSSFIKIAVNPRFLGKAAQHGFWVEGNHGLKNKDKIVFFEYFVFAT